MYPIEEDPRLLLSGLLIEVSQFVSTIMSVGNTLMSF
jgi:hypothetical protein